MALAIRLWSHSRHEHQHIILLEGLLSSADKTLSRFFLSEAHDDGPQWWWHAPSCTGRTLLFVFSIFWQYCSFEMGFSLFRRQLMWRVKWITQLCMSPSPENTCIIYSVYCQLWCIFIFCSLPSQRLAFYFQLSQLPLFSMLAFLYVFPTEHCVFSRLNADLLNLWAQHLSDTFCSFSFSYEHIVRQLIKTNGFLRWCFLLRGSFLSQQIKFSVNGHRWQPTDKLKPSRTHV